MKKIALFVTTVVLAYSVNAQNVASVRVGTTNTFDPSLTYFGGGASFQHGMSGNVALGLNFDYHVGSGSTSLINIEPRVDYYFNSVFNGFRVGSNIGFNMGTGSTKNLMLGVGLGYSHPLSDNMILDIGTGIGYLMSLETGGGGGLAAKPNLSLGFKF